MKNFGTATDVFDYYWFLIQHDGSDRGNSLAIFNEGFTICSPRLRRITSIHRKWNEKYAEREWQWYLSGDRSVKDIKKYAPIWEKMHNGDDLVWSNYGYWWKYNSQLKKVVEILKADMYTRRAVVVHYAVELLDQFNKDTPCNLVLNFYIDAGKLHITVMARSIDLWYGFCNDQYIFSRLLSATARELNIDMGTMTYFITNFHIYKDKLS